MAQDSMNTRQKVPNECLYPHKIRPSFYVPLHKEFQPSNSCKTCSAPLDLKTTVYEELGVRNLLLHNSSIPSVVRQEFDSVQVHQGQIQHLIETNSIKVFVSNYESSMDQLILAFALGTFQENPEFSQQLEDVKDTHHFPRHIKPSMSLKGPHVIFINLQDADQHLNNLMSQINTHSTMENVELIPTALSYEFLPDKQTPKATSPKPSVRINFGQAYSFKNTQLQETDEGSKDVFIQYFMQHIRHDIWKNKAIMAVHVMSVLTRYESGPLNYISKIKEFQREYLSSYDVGYIGELEDIVNYSLLILSTKKPQFKTIALDVLKYESMMMQSIVVTVNQDQRDLHSATIQIHKSQMLDKFRLLSRILVNEVGDIYPPCTDASVIEKEALEHLLCRAVVSYQSDEQECQEHQTARRMAQYLDVDFEDDDWLPATPTETILYVNLESLSARKWISNITSSILDVYYVTARQLLELQKVDVLELCVLIEMVAQDFIHTFNRQTGLVFECTVGNAIDLFQSEGLVRVEHFNNVKTICLVDPLDNQNVLQVINDIAQFLIE